MAFDPSGLRAQPFVETVACAARFWQIGLLWRLLATGHKTAGSLCFIDEVNGGEEGGPVTHTHPQDEGLYLIAGRCTFFAGGQTITAEAGTFVAVPRHTEHAFMAAPDARFLNFYLPSGFEFIVTGLGVPALRNEPPGPGEFTLPPRELVDKLGADYGQIAVRGTPFADPPLLEHMATAPQPGAKVMPYAINASAAPAYWSNDILWSVLADGATTGGRYTLFEQLCPAGSGAPPHVHLSSDEAFYMLEGEAEFMAGDVREIASAGTLVFIPRGMAHAFRVRSAARMLNLYSQSGFERLIELTGHAAAERKLPPQGLAPVDISASQRARTMAEIGLQVLPWPDPFG